MEPHISTTKTITIRQQTKQTPYLFHQQPTKRGKKMNGKRPNQPNGTPFSPSKEQDAKEPKFFNDPSKQVQILCENCGTPMKKDEKNSLSWVCPQCGAHRLDAAGLIGLLQSRLS